MDSGYYAAFSGWLARSEALDAAASNLANVNTSGFRAQREYFRNAITGPEALQSQVNQIVNNYGVLGGNLPYLGQGALTHTGNPLDLAIEGQGFFAVQTRQGIRYTRDGSFRRALDGTLVTASGEPVLNARNQPILVPSGEVEVGVDGVISVAGAVAGKVGVFDLPASALVPEGANRYAIAAGTKPVVTAAAIHQGALESSNEDVIQGTLNLILVQRQAEMMQKTLSNFYNNFDKTASEDLPKI
ncbi:flagellar hook-basal body protein [Pseudacidobacterium ailaaui]|uniref:flagellar hook-basal body protein n=1 Tax=Pseudacidobacterium ailaaui TaxID=1382359 RepID=UPI00047CC7D1|nr:flagellar hook basal-body protein [Pseudacidobacterium ailaaui]MBX6358454.1 flagellar hook basal-body protein [Pseudacidobacterium ailaaui]MCL6464000.1 flagellar hook basal-body protein [Pseudacidobacterium ailaaui]MDI3254270.1 flagellar hook basal-body protein [Bacillota bacterium]